MNGSGSLFSNRAFFAASFELSLVVFLADASWSPLALCLRVDVERGGGGAAVPLLLGFGQ